MNNSKTFKIRCYSFDSHVLDNLCKQIGSVLRGAVDSVSVVPMKTRSRLDLPRSNFVYSTAKNQLAQVGHIRCFIIKCSDVSLLQKRLAAVKLPFGVELEIRLVP